MRALGLDVGDRRIGVALSDLSGIIAGRLKVLERKGSIVDLKVIKQLVDEHGVETLVVGLPLTLKGEQGIQAKKVIDFTNALKQHLSIPVEYIDERLTTVQGTRILQEIHRSSRKRKQLIDQTAAQLILQQYLDQNRND